MQTKKKNTILVDFKSTSGKPGSHFEVMGTAINFDLLAVDVFKSGIIFWILNL
jgi:hypothetical protein